ncbi:uncharacterized protein RB166_016677 [Leptodactylus fuscus]|uniref:uncharacterized protein LOC142216197 n=1 Tax=Leptodactylus fuscus TaxID=238119 RepID=UPI003F4E56D2
MVGLLGKIALLFVLFTCFSSLVAVTTNGPEFGTSSVENLPTLSINNSLLNDFAPINQINTLTEPSAEEQKVDLANTTDSKVTAEQDASSSLTTQEEKVTITAPTTSLVPTKDAKETPVKEIISDVASPVTTSTPVMVTSTISKDPSPSNFSLRPVTDHIPTAKDPLDTSHENNKTKDPETSSSHPSNETNEIPTEKATQAPKTPPVTSQKPSDKDKQKLFILILVFIVILVLILVAVVVIMVRNKRRRGSQSFHSQKRSSKKQDVWAGQVPELGDGRITQNPIGMENGTAGNKAEPGKEQEMVTFISGDKKNESVVEINELGKGDTLEEKQPLLEDSSQVSGEAEKPPVEEQMPTLTVEQIEV